MFYLLCSVVFAGCGKATVAPAETPAGAGSAPAAGDGGGFTISLDGVTLQFSDDWMNGGSAPGNPGKGALLGRTPQEASEQAISFVALPMPLPQGITMSNYQEILTKFSDSQFSKMEKDSEVQIAGVTARFQLIRLFGSPGGIGLSKEDTFQHKWTFNTGTKLFQFVATCHESQLPQAGPKFEEVIQSMKMQ